MVSMRHFIYWNKGHIQQTPEETISLLGFVFLSNRFWFSLVVMGSITQLIYSKKYDLEIIAFGSLTIINDTNECVEVIFRKKQSTFPTS